MHYNNANKQTDKLSMRITKEDNIWQNIGLTLKWSQVESPNYHNGFPFDLDDHKKKWSRHQSFLYGCDRSPEMRVFELGIEIPNVKQHNWSTKMISKF